MDVSSIAGASVLAKLGQTQSAMSTSMMKMAANQQDQVANMLAQNAKQAVQPAASSGHSFSTYA